MGGGRAPSQHATHHEEQGVAVRDGQAEAAVEEEDGGAYPPGDALEHAHAH